MKISRYLTKRTAPKSTQPKKIKDVIQLIEKGHNAKECINAYLDIKTAKISPGDKTDKAKEKLFKLSGELSEKLTSSQNENLKNLYLNAINAVSEICNSFIKELSEETKKSRDNFNLSLPIDLDCLNDPNLLKQFDEL